MSWVARASVEGVRSKYRSASFGAAAAATLALAVLTTPASALTTTGVAVGSVGSSTQVGLAPVFNATLGGNAIPFFVPLGQNPGGTYGTFGFNPAGCASGYATCSDTGNGGPVMTMILRFSPINPAVSNTLTVKFVDLDLSGANDPANFLEAFNLRDENGVSILPGGNPITSIGGLITGNNNSQTLTYVLPNGVLETPLWLLLRFQASWNQNGTNTLEHLLATITSLDPPGGGNEETPLPAAALLFGSVMAGSWGVSKWRKRSRKVQA